MCTGIYRTRLAEILQSLINPYSAVLPSQFILYMFPASKVLEIIRALAEIIWHILIELYFRLV